MDAGVNYALECICVDRTAMHSEHRTTMRYLHHHAGNNITALNPPTTDRSLIDMTPLLQFFLDISTVALHRGEYALSYSRQSRTDSNLIDSDFPPRD